MRATIPTNAAPVDATIAAALPPPGTGSADARLSRYSSRVSTLGELCWVRRGAFGGGISPAEPAAALPKERHSKKRLTYVTRGRTVPVLDRTAGDVKDRSLAEAGRSRIAWARRTCRCWPNSRSLRNRKTAQGRPHRRVSARHDRNREPDAGASGRRRGNRALREQSALDAGRRCCRALRVRHSDVRDQRRRQRHVLFAHRSGRRDETADVDGRRLRPRDRRSTRSTTICSKT